MIETEIPKDILKVKTTLIGPFTARQILFLVLAGAAEYVFFHYFSGYLSLTADQMAGIGSFIAVPFLLMGFYEPMGMPLERFLKNILILGYIAPKVRVYQVETVSYKAEEKGQHVQSKRKKFSASELRKHPDYIMYE